MHLTNVSASQYVDLFQCHLNIAISNSFVKNITTLFIAFPTKTLMPNVQYIVKLVLLFNARKSSKSSILFKTQSARDRLTANQHNLQLQSFLKFFARQLEPCRTQPFYLNCFDSPHTRDFNSLDRLVQPVHIKAVT